MLKKGKNDGRKEKKEGEIERKKEKGENKKTKEEASREAKKLNTEVIPISFPDDVMSVMPRPSPTWKPPSTHQTHNTIESESDHLRCRKKKMKWGTVKQSACSTNCVAYSGSVNSIRLYIRGKGNDVVMRRIWGAGKG